MHKNAIVKVDRCAGIVCLLLNIFLVGSGTIIAGCLTQHSNKQIKMNNFIVGAFQLILLPYAGLGWFWSVYIGYKLFERSGGAWMGFKRVEYVSEEDKRE